MTTPGLIEAARAAGAVSHAQGRSRSSARLWAAVLTEVPLFQHVPARHLRSIAGHGTVVRFEPGSVVLRTGQPGDAFYVVLDGIGSIIRPGGLPLIPVSPGSYFGESALLDGEPRTATIRADSEMTCLRLGRSVFLKVLREQPSVSLALLRVLSERLRAARSEDPV
jgi:CRP-like cAMP-binding protein